MKYKRTLDDMNEYDQRKRNITEFFDSIEEYISLKVFMSKNQSFVLCRNKYPYTHRKYHYNLWRNPRYDHLLEYEFSDVYKQIYFSNCEIFENEECDKSVKSITHYHILSDEQIDYRKLYSLVF